MQARSCAATSWGYEFHRLICLSWNCVFLCGGVKHKACVLDAAFGSSFHRRCDGWSLPEPPSATLSCSDVPAERVTKAVIGLNHTLKIWPMFPYFLFYYFQPRWGESAYFWSEIDQFIIMINDVSYDLVMHFGTSTSIGITIWATVQNKYDTPVLLPLSTYWWRSEKSWFSRSFTKKWFTKKVIHKVI